MSEANKDLVRRHFEEIWNHQDLSVADELMASDYLDHAVAPFGQAEPGRVNGPAALRQTVQWLLAQFPDLHMRIEAIVAEGDTVAVRVLSEGTNLGPLNGVVPPTGKRFAARQSHWFRVADRRLAEHWATREDWWRCCSWACCSRPARRRPNCWGGDGGELGGARTTAVTPAARLARPRRWPGVVAWTLWALAMAVWLVIPWLDQQPRQAGRPDLTQWDLRPAVAAVSVATVGAVLASRRPRHPVGWLLLAQVATNLATGAAAQYLAWGLLPGGPF